MGKRRGWCERPGRRGGGECGAEDPSPAHGGHRARVPRAALAGAGAIGAALLATGCGDGTAAPAKSYFDPHSRPIGRSAAFHPAPRGSLVRAGRPIHGLYCRGGAQGRYGIHLEIFAHRLVVIVPAGIGVGPPVVHRGAYVVSGRCSYPVRTIEPTGVIQVARGAKMTLRDFFALWQQPLTRNRLLSFRGAGGRSIHAFYNGRPWRDDPGAIPLKPHAEITLEVNGFVPLRLGYRFRPGL